MTTYLAPEVQAGLDDARRRARKAGHRLRVRTGEDIHRVIRVWDDGFSLDRSVANHLRGRVDLFDGTELVSQCLIVASDEDGDEILFEYKRITEAVGEQPVDFERDANAPTALIGQG